MTETGCFYQGRDVKLLVVGLDNAGKTTLINKMKPFICQKDEITPTTGYQTSWVPYKNMILRLIDMGGQYNFRPLWKQNTSDIDGIIFVIDSSDSIRFKNAAEELHDLLNDKTIQNTTVPLLVYANKNDIEGSSTLDVISANLRLEEQNKHPHLILSVCRQNPAQIFFGLEWLTQMLN